MTTQVTAMSGQSGDIFWDLPTWITYASGYDIGCNIYVANPADEVQEYALLARLYRNGTVISEEALPVFGYTWFDVEPGDFVTLKGALRFTETDAVLTVSLYEKGSGEVIDSVSTQLVAASSAVLPPSWSGGTGSSGWDWSSFINTILPILLLIIVALALLKPLKKPKPAEVPVATKEILAQGRESNAG